MILTRRLALVSLALGFGHVVFGAVVRVTGSGMGCGDHWPTCQGYWIPPFTRVDLIIEVTHRYFAAALAMSIVALLASAWLRRHESGMMGRGGVFRPALLGTGLVVAAALFGAVTVWLELANKLVIVTHLTLAMGLLAVLVVSIVRAGGPPRIPLYTPSSPSPSPFEPRPQHSDARWTSSPQSARAATVAATLGFITIVLGALTAHIPGANTACVGFPLCRGGVLPTDPSQYLQYTHRVIAFALFLLMGWLGVVLTQRQEPKLAAFARLALTVIFLQLVVAATMVELQLPPLWRSLHEAVGTLLWIVLFAFAYVAHRLAFGAAAVPNERVAVIAPAAGVRA